MSYPPSNIQDPKRKVHKPIRGVLRLEIEKHQTVHSDLENLSESGSMTNESVDPGDRITDSTLRRCPSNGSDCPQSSSSKWNTYDGKESSGNSPSIHGNPEMSADDVSITC